jgi:hypothetical protein
MKYFEKTAGFLDVLKGKHIEEAGAVLKSLGKHTPKSFEKTLRKQDIPLGILKRKEKAGQILGEVKKTTKRQHKQEIAKTVGAYGAIGGTLGISGILAGRN